MDQGRRPLACARCFRRKQRCDREVPRCSECVRAAADCVPRGHESLEADSPIGVIQYMKRRIYQLENALSSPDAAAISTSPPVINRPRSPPLSASSHARTHSMSMPTRGDPVESALGQIGFLSLNAMGHSASAARGIAERVMCSTLVSEAMSLDGSDPAASKLMNGVHDRLSSSTFFVGASGDLNYDAIEWSEVVERFSDLSIIYLSGIPALNCFDLFQTWQAVRRNALTPTLLQTEPERLVLAEVMLATGICMTGRSKSSEIFASALMKDTAKTVQTLQDRALLQFLILQIVLCLYHPLGGSAWSLVGLAMSKAISLGLHHGTSQPEEANTPEQQDLFSVIYVLDRTIALAIDRPFAIADSDTSLHIRGHRSPTATDPNQSSTDNDGNSPGSESTSLRTSFIHHAQLMSEMRHNPIRSSGFHLMNYYHWRDSFQRIIVSEDGVRERDRSLQTRRSSTIYRHRLQLHCRAIIQLSIMATHDSSSTSDCTSQLRREALDTIPYFISYLSQCMDRYAIALTFVDGYDIFAMVLVFIHYCLSNTSGSTTTTNNVTSTTTPNTSPNAPTTSNNNTRHYSQTSNTTPLSNKMSLEDMKFVFRSMDLLHSVAERFEAMKPLRDVIWAFMTARESVAAAVAAAASSLALSSARVEAAGGRGEGHHGDDGQIQQQSTPLSSSSSSANANAATATSTASAATTAAVLNGIEMLRGASAKTSVPRNLAVFMEESLRQVEFA